MSVVIAVKDGDKIYVGADCQGTRGQIKIKCSKVFPIKNCPNGIIGGAGILSEIQALSFQENLISKKTQKKNGVNSTYLFNIFFPKVLYILETLKRLPSNSTQCNSSLILAYKDKAWEIDAYGAISELAKDKDFLVIGSGVEVAIGSLSATKNLPAKERIELAVQACNDNTIYVNDTIEIFNT